MNTAALPLASDYGAIGPTSENTVSPLEHYFYLARRKWKLIAAILLGFLVLGLVVTMLTTPQYRSTARIEISQIDTNVADVEGVDRQRPIMERAYLQTQYELLESRSQAERVARAARLQSDPAFLEAYGLSPEATIPMGTIIAILRRDVTIDPVVGSNLVDIRFTSPDRELSAKIANTWAQQFITSNFDRLFGSNVQAREYLSERLSEVRESLEESESELIDYATSRQIVQIGNGGNGTEGDGVSRTLVSDELETLNSQLANATAARIEAESSSLSPRSASSETLGSVAAFRRQLASARAELADVSSRLGDQHPAVIALRSQIEELESAIATETRRASSESQRNVASARANERALRQRIASLKSEFLREQQAGVQFAILDRDVRTNRELYDALLQQYKNLGAAGVGRNNMAMVDAAEVANNPVEPNLLSNLLIFLAMGTLASLGMLYAIESVDNGFTDTAQVESELGLPLLGAIPRTSGISPAEELEMRSSELYESYTTARSNLSFLTNQGIPKTLMLTSSRAAEGKSLSAFALSKLTAEQGKRVLLIDGDMRNSGLGKYIDVENTVGLSNLLAGEELEADGIISLSEDKFDVLPSGRVPPNAAELLAGPALSALMQKFRSRYDHVIIDGPPVLGLADVQEMGRVLDGVVMIIEAGGSKQRAVRQALKRVQKNGTRVYGALMTKVTDDGLHYGYGYGYGYGSQQSEKSEPA
ncbi:GumC family protein [Aurantiacibacter aquimixticola]|uniref:non-specific protein-tyrosine kinase n=1 Tax=Aurantiacibacter aquimixticola TaxID=1958945 RepID=A0A419RSG5_9SPHN|nr:polysaccharide biosynthesis tyrosine autokinase [Aurantiacibacter aquimixticola]RJY08727.1 polysaccharide biosynthesis tyrosine autokinase [Aurantiacibacter aquimixticola]